MDFNKFLSWLKSLPVWLRVIVLALIAGLILIFSLSFTSCGTPKTIATVQNVNPNSTVTVTLSVSNETNSSVPVEVTSPSLKTE